MGLKKSTQVKYLSIYEAYKGGMPRHQIMLQFKCDRTTIWRALTYFNKHCLDLTEAHEIDIAIEAKRTRIYRLNQLIEKEEQKTKINLNGLIGLYREVRELEKATEELKGLYDWKTRGAGTFEEIGEDVDLDAISRAATEVGSAAEEE